MAYMVAFMDYAKDDISRPAAIPGWSEIDYNPGGGWLNSTRVAPHIFTDYAQTLNMHDATLTTSYRFVYANKSTDVKVTTFVSQAANHLAATQLSITPQFDGSVQLTFPIRLWSEHAPRFPIARLSGDEMVAAVIASGQTLDNKPIPMSDRDAVWYHGVTRVSAADGDAKDLTLWLDGRAEQGLTMAEAAAISLPAGLRRRGHEARKRPVQAVAESHRQGGKGKNLYIYQVHRDVAAELGRRREGDARPGQGRARDRFRQAARGAPGRLARAVEVRHRRRRRCQRADRRSIRICTICCRIRRSAPPGRWAPARSRRTTPAMHSGIRIRGCSRHCCCCIRSAPSRS